MCASVSCRMAVFFFNVSDFIASVEHIANMTILFQRFFFFVGQKDTEVMYLSGMKLTRYIPSTAVVPLNPAWSYL